MTSSRFLYIAALATVLLGGSVALYAELSNASWEVDLLPGALFSTAWVLLPWALTYRLARGSRRSAYPYPELRNLVLILLGVFWAYAYRGLLFPVGRPRSTSALDLIFIPLWHLVSLILPTLIRSWRRRDRSEL